MPPITTIMVLTNVGLQLFNNWRSASTSEELRKKQQEFQEAAQRDNQARMMQLLREGQALQEEMEVQMHEERIKNINEDFDHLIRRVFHAAALGKWPLRVLPMVMKNQSLGSFRANSNENVALHVIFTPSNCTNFNSSVFPQIEQGLEVFMNRHWNELSSHPILFYGGAWKSGIAPNPNEIAQLKADLPHLPVLMITPYFQPNNGKLVFNVHMWGMGRPQDVVIQPTEQEFSYYNIYAPGLKYGEDLASTTIEEFVPYLQCVIGYLADVYFWSAHAATPILPSLLTMGAVNTDGLKYLLASNQERYETLLLQAETQSTDFPTNAKGILNLYKGTAAFWNEETQNKEILKLNEMFPDFQEKYIYGNGRIEQKQGIFISPSEFNNDKYIQLSVPQYDIMETIQQFDNFVQSNTHRIPFVDPALYIEMDNYSTFKFHLYNAQTKQLFILPDGFDYIIHCSKLIHSKQIKTLFKYKNKDTLVCRKSRIDKLSKAITANNLIY